jgi:hypothetical protein
VTELPPQASEYLVVFKADANARFRRPEQAMSFRAEVSGAPAFITFATRFTDEGHEAAVPRELIVQGRGVALSIDDAIQSLGPFASAMANLTAFVTNAAINPLSLYLGVDATPGHGSRTFMQEFGEFDVGPVQQGRAIPVDEVGAVLGLMGAAAHLEAGWATAVQHYGIALTRWRLGSEPFVLTPLYTAAEALEKTIVLQEADRRGQSLVDLCRAIGARDTKQAGAYYRRTVVFQGDADFLQAVRDLSDGLEHGSINVGDAQARAVDLTPRLFRLIRECLLDRLSAPPELRDVLLGSRYGAPLDPTLRKLVIGEMTGLPDEMGPPGVDYPFLTWDTGLASLAFDDEGELQAKMSENFTVHTADGGGFALKGLRMYGRPTDATKPPLRLQDVQVTYGSGETPGAGRT